MKRPLALATVLKEALAGLHLEEAALDARILAMWAEVVGEQLGAVSRAATVRAGTLTVITQSSAWSQDLSFHRPTIFERYRERLGRDRHGRDYVREIRFRVGVLPVRRGKGDGANLAGKRLAVRGIRLPDARIREISTGIASDDEEMAQAIRRSLTRQAQADQWNREHGAAACTRCGAAHRTGTPLCPACRIEDGDTPVRGHAEPDPPYVPRNPAPGASNSDG